VSAAAGAGADAGRMVVSVATSRPVLAASLGDASVRVLRFDTAAGKWVEPTITPDATATGLASVDALGRRHALSGVPCRHRSRGLLASDQPPRRRRAKPCPPAAAATPACSPPTPPPPEPEAVMSTYQWKNMDAGLLSMVAKVARNEPLSAAEELSVAEFLKGYAGTRGDWGFATTPTGDVRGSNNLRRTNWFNGRYLTAEALSRQDVYFDARLRLGAHAQMPGIAWGLGITAGANATPVTANPAAAACRPARPSPCAAGWPSTTSAARSWSRSPSPSPSRSSSAPGARRPRRWSAAASTSCPACASWTTPPAPPAAAPVPSGPYLLVIQPNESEEGGAKVMGEICGGAAAVNCRAEAWRGGFGLSLVRFPVELPLRQDLVSAWDLRGTLSAYFFDVFEHPLWKRWDPDFLTNGPFCSDTGPGRHDAAAVALAMVYLGEDGSVLFLDQWIPAAPSATAPPKTGTAPASAPRRGPPPGRASTSSSACWPRASPNSPSAASGTIFIAAASATSRRSASCPSRRSRPTAS
jgi:hypothetical protein